MIYNFNISPKNGKTYYENNIAWKDYKFRIKQILDEKNSSRENKINSIIALTNYYNYYLTKK